MMFDYGWDEYYSLPFQTSSHIQCYCELADFGGEEYEKLWDDIFEWFDGWYYKQLYGDKMIYKKISRINLKQNISEISELLEDGETIEISPKQINLNLKESDKRYEVYPLNSYFYIKRLFVLLKETRNVESIKINYDENDVTRVIIKITKTDGNVFSCDIRDAILVFDYDDKEFVEMIDSDECTFEHAIAEKGYVEA